MTDWLKVAIDFVTLIISLCAMGYAWFRTRDAAANKKITALANEVATVRKELSLEREERSRAIENERNRRSDTNGRLKDRLTALEEQMKHLPTIELHSALHRDLNKLEGQVGALGSKLDATNATTQLIHEYLLNQSADTAGKGGRVVS